MFPDPTWQYPHGRDVDYGNEGLRLYPGVSKSSKNGVFFIKAHI